MSNSFEDKILTLEKLVKDLEDEDKTLSESMELFEKGIKLYNDCQKELKSAENTIEILNDKIEK